MFALIATGAAIALVLGAACKAALDRTSGPERITRNEYLIGALVITLFVCPATAAVGTQMAVSANSTFNEYWNGWEESTPVSLVECTRDGSCRHDYNCDPYVVLETYYS